MTTHTKIFQILMLAGAILALFAGAQLVVAPKTAEATSTSTVNLIMQKNISGPSPYTAVDFTFNISGNGVNEQLTISDLGTGFYSSPLTLSEGAYTITEMGPDGWVPEEWTVLWAGECTELTEFTAQFVVNAGNMGDGDQYCSAENQYRPGVLKVEKKFASSTTSVPFEDFTFKVTQGTVIKEEVFESDGNNSVNIGKGTYSVTENPIPGYTPSYSDGCSGTINNSQNITCTITNTYTGGNGGGDGDTGTLVVKKIVSGGTAATSSFSFMIDGGTATAFESDGENVITGVSTGTHSVTEASVSGYTVTYDNCSGVTVSANATTTCTITNTYSNGGGNGGETTYLVFGYVWHDENENDNWEQEQPNPDDDEFDLDGWAVEITNGSTTYATTTDPSGYYYFYIPAGTWTINETIQSGWSKTYPNDNGHVVVVGEVTLEEDHNFFVMIMDYLLPTAHAAVSPIEYGPFNFGNVYFGQGGGDGGNGGGGGGGGGSSIGGRISDSSEGEVLGAQVDVVPVLAANAGFGGAAKAFSLDVLTLMSLFIAAAVWSMVRKGFNVR